MRFYLDEYSKGYISVEGLVSALAELLNTRAKVKIIILYYVILYYFILYYTILYYFILYYIIL